ncbi:hypothetical protein Bhyg_04447 [Pseudolycoriella hygida]|uniref:Ig-like domain-containing protein n=1 Tax=Pseudolycoriella hygida TaxID=35572 RepID=A0A9Q0NFJ2_9DIPT|nr:hypothetical protein Bhyg_04447 [Pseudolycoriella hygida]
MRIHLYVASAASQCKLHQPVSEDPEFTDIIENITVAQGRNVKFGCSVKNLGSYKVAWMHFEQSAILTVHNHVITRNPHSKYLSNLNDINKSEQKSIADTSKGFGWPTEENKK